MSFFIPSVTNKPIKLSVIILSVIMANVVVPYSIFAQMMFA